MKCAEKQVICTNWPRYLDTSRTAVFLRTHCALRLKNHNASCQREDMHTQTHKNKTLEIISGKVPKISKPHLRHNCLEEMSSGWG